MNKNKKKLLILGGKPIGSVDIVNYAKSQGIYTIVTDYLPDEESPAKMLADETWSISTADVETLCHKIQERQINALFTGIHEFNINKALQICERCKLPFYASPKQMEVLSNKDKYKQLFHQFGMPIIKQLYAGDLAHAPLIDAKHFPLMIKPIDGSGGFGVKICASPSTFDQIIQESVKYSKSNQVIIEELIDAPEISIFYLIKDGRLALSAMADRITQCHQEGIIPLPVEYNFPSCHLDEFQSQYNEKIIAALRSMELKNGMLFIQAFWRQGECFIYDIGYRLTGTQEYNIIEAICGYNALKMLVDYAVDGQMGKGDFDWSRVDPSFHGKHASNLTYLMKCTDIASIQGIEEAQEVDGVVRVILNHQIGESVPLSAAGTLVQVLLRVFFICDSEESLEQSKRKVRALIKAVNKNGEDIIL